MHIHMHTAMMNINNCKEKAEKCHRCAAMRIPLIDNDKSLVRLSFACQCDILLEYELPGCKLALVCGGIFESAA